MTVLKIPTNGRLRAWNMFMRNHADAVGRMQKLFLECLNDHKADNADDADDTLDTAIDSWGAVVEDTSTGYRHTWTITEETVV